MLIYNLAFVNRVPLKLKGRRQLANNQAIVQYRVYPRYGGSIVLTVGYVVLEAHSF